MYFSIYMHITLHCNINALVHASRGTVRNHEEAEVKRTGMGEIRREVHT